MNFLKNVDKISLMVGISLVLSMLGYHLIGKIGHPFIGFGILYSLQYLIFALFIVLAVLQRRVSVEFVIAIAVGCRVILWFTDPALESDYWRYLWDGRVTSHGINPFLYPPLDTSLDGLDINYRHFVAWKQFRTIYPPVAQFFFAAIQLIAPNSVLGLKIMLTLFDLGTGLILVQWFKKKNQNPSWSALYFLNPLVLKEIANSAHLDSIPVFFVFLAAYLVVTQSHSWKSWLSLALASSAKLYPIVLVPLFLKTDPRKKKSMVFFLAFTGLFYLPFIGAKGALFSGTTAYGKYWIWNASLFRLVSLGANSILRAVISGSENNFMIEALKNDYPAKILLGITFVLFLVWKTRRFSNTQGLPSAVLFILGLLLIISPVVDPWYVLWLLPFACLTKNIPWIAFSYLSVASYSWFYSKESAVYFRFTEYFIFFALLFFWEFRHRKFLHCTVPESIKS